MDWVFFSVMTVFWSLSSEYTLLIRLILLIFQSSSSNSSLSLSLHHARLTSFPESPKQLLRHHTYNCLPIEASKKEPSPPKLRASSRVPWTPSRADRWLYFGGDTGRLPKLHPLIPAPHTSATRQLSLFLPTNLTSYARNSKLPSPHTKTLDRQFSGDGRFARHQAPPLWALYWPERLRVSNYRGPPCTRGTNVNGPATSSCGSRRCCLVRYPG